MQTNKERGNDVPQPAADSELEKYGVWVKAEPQEIVEEPEVAHEFLDASEISEAAGGSDADEPFSFDIPELDEEPSLSTPGDDLVLEAAGEAPDADSSSDAGFDADILDIETLDSDGSFASLDTELDEGIVEDGVIELPLDELDDLESFEALDEAEGSRPAAGGETGAEQPAGDAFETTELSLEDFGFDMEEPSAEESRAAPAAGAEPETVDLSEFGLEDEAAASPEAQDGAEDFENLDLDLHFDDTIPSSAEAEESSFSLDDIADIGGEPLPGPELAMEDVTADFESMSIEPSADASAGPTPRPAEREGASLDSFIDDDEGGGGIMPELGEESVRFDDVSAVERELGQTPSTRDEGTSAELLKAIAGELAAIKGELVSLRGQLVTLKASQAAPEAAGAEEEAESDEAAGGFFDEEEDDTIALTGDELDNILNTADFTEEAQPEETPAGLEPDLAGLDLLPEDGEYAEAAPIEEQAAEELGIEGFGLDEAEALADAAPAADILAELPEDIDIAPLTVIEDDTSYLEGENDLAAFGEELQEPPLVEPTEEELIVEADDELAVEEDDETELELELPDEDADGISLELPEDDELVLSLEGVDEGALDAGELGAEILDEDESLAELEDLPAEDSEFDIELHAEDHGEELAGGFDADDGELMELEEIDELSEPSPDFGDLDALDDAVVSPSSPVELHPDELSSSLDESLFVDAGAEPEEAERVFDLSSPDDIKMPSFGPPEVEPEADFQAIQTAPSAPPAPVGGQDKLKSDVKSVLLYLDQLLASLPEEKIEEFAASEYYETYKKLFDELGLL